ncbi:MAG: 16S rRNA (cytosine(967)-C(5))-methyltransferase RsmB [Clostridia bacterium]|nr:16S rRNA (cytosine(967)-C(5))-methyltransferase RsmB [Clostridia bacterium]
MGKVNPAREAALSSLLKMKSGKYTNLEVNATLGKTELTGADKGLYTALVYGVCERVITLDKTIAKYSKTPLDKIDEKALAALRLGIYQLAFMDKIPDHAAVDESVTMAGKRAGGFVNAILRSFIRDEKRIELPEKGNSEYISVAYSVPTELCERFIGWYGYGETEKIFAAFLENEKITLRVNNLKTTREKALEMLGAEPSAIAENSICTDSFDGVSEGIEKGYWYVQDAASALAVSTLGAKPGELVVDTCACPGGKSFGVAIDMKNEGKLYSFDIHENKLSLIKKGARKLDIDIITASKRDARDPDPELFEKADRVLCDAPCSGLGVIGKKPDIKYKELSSIDNLPTIQYDVLCGAAKYVKAGGVLLYSTCTLNPEENFGVCRRFLENNNEFSMEPFVWAKGECNGALTLMPHIDGTDGFFICKMRRKENNNVKA